MCPVGIWMIASKLGWLRMAADYDDVSSQMGSTRITRHEVFVFVDEARTCRTAFRMSSGSYYGFAMHDPVRR